MRLLRNLLPLLTVGIATVSIAGVSAALEANPTPPVAPPTEPAPADEELVCTDGTTPEGDDCDDAEVNDAVEEPKVTTTHPDNHGAAVSEAAHTCPTGPEHGACVSEVARSNAGKDHGGADESDDQAARNGKSNGGGNGGADPGLSGRRAGGSPSARG